MMRITRCCLRSVTVAITVGLLVLLISIATSVSSVRAEQTESKPLDTAASKRATAQPPRIARAAAQDSLLPPTTSTTRLPTTKANTLGFTLDIQIAEQPSSGYIPVHIAARSTSTFAADRRLTIRFQTDPNGQLPPTNGLQVDVPLLLPQGSSLAQATRYLPKWSAGYQYRISVYEQGRPLEACFTTIGAADTDFYDNEQRLNWLFVTDTDTVDYGTLPDLRPLLFREREMNIRVFRDSMLTPRQDPRFWETIMQNGPHHVVGQSELPTDWRGYQNYDLIILDQPALQAAIQNGKYETIHQWVLNGGSIALYDSASEKAFVDAFGLPIQKPTSLALNHILREPILNEGTSQPVDEGWNQKIWLRPLGAGVVFGVLQSDDGEFPNTRHWWVIDHTLGHRVSPMLRRGVDPILGDRRFGRWLIPGVAQPPVYTFMGLLALFVILVGPVAYRSTAKRGRTYLMFLIAPILAIITTALMFTYGVISDGFGTSARVRQLTWVDGASESAGERIQSTYFAGLRPTEGLSFAGNAEVMRYPDGTAGSWEELNERSPVTLGNIRVEGDRQIFDSAFLPSRQQRQFIVHQPRQKIGSISIKTEKSDLLNPTGLITNRFDFELRQCIIRDAEGDYWYAERVPRDSDEVECEAVDSRRSSKLIGDLYNEYRPMEEDLFQSPQRRFRRLTRDLISNISDQVKNHSMSSSEVLSGTFEFWLNERMQLEGELPRDHFVAVSDVTDDVVVVPETELVDSVRFVYGSLK